MITAKEQRDRHLYTSRVYAGICQLLDQAAQMQLQDSLDSIILQNCRLMGDITPSFSWEGQLYFYGHLNRYNRTINGASYTKLNLVLHPSLAGECNAVFKEYKKRLAYTKKAKDYAATILSRMPTLYDVKQLIPDSYRDTSQDRSDLYDNGPQLTAEEMAEWKANHREGEEIFVKLQLLELIGAR